MTQQAFLFFIFRYYKVGVGRKGDGGIVGSRLAPKNAHVLILGACEYVPFADVLKNLQMGNCPGLSE